MSTLSLNIIKKGETGYIYRTHGENKDTALCLKYIMGRGNFVDLALIL
jgi:hypothetical protein